MFTVSKQIQWPEGRPVVEISAGGLDYCNPDMLGRATEFADPREAVEFAIGVCNAWRKGGETRAKLGHGATGGFTLPFDPTTYKGARAWAEKVWDKLPKCAGCPDPLPDDKRDRFHADDWSGLEYCSGPCAEREAGFQALHDAEEQEAA